MTTTQASAIHKRLIQAGARVISLHASFESKDFHGGTISETVFFELPELDSGLYKCIVTDEDQVVYVGPRGLWCKVNGVHCWTLEGEVEVYSPVFGDTQDALKDSALSLCMDKFYNAAIINDDIVKPVDFPLFAILDRGSLGVTSKANDDSVAFTRPVENITLDHVIDHWRVPLVDIDKLRAVYNEWADWRMGMLASSIDRSMFVLDDDTDGLSFEDEEVIEYLKHNKQCFVDDDLDEPSVYLPSVDEIEAVDMIMYNVEQLQTDEDAVFPSRIHDIARAWSKYEEARQKASVLD